MLNETIIENDEQRLDTFQNKVQWPGICIIFYFPTATWRHSGFGSLIGCLPEPWLSSDDIRPTHRALPLLPPPPPPSPGIWAVSRGDAHRHPAPGPRCTTSDWLLPHDRGRSRRARWALSSRLGKSPVGLMRANRAKSERFPENSSGGCRALLFSANWRNMVSEIRINIRIKWKRPCPGSSVIGRSYLLLSLLLAMSCLGDNSS